MNSALGPKIRTPTSGFTTKCLDHTPQEIQELTPRPSPKVTDRHDMETGFNSGYFGQAPTLEASNQAFGASSRAKNGRPYSPSESIQSSSESAPGSDSSEAQPSEKSLPRIQSGKQSEGCETSSHHTGMDPQQFVQEFIATKYTASSEKQRDIIVSNYKYMMYFIMLNIPREVYQQFTDIGPLFKMVKLHNLVIILLCIFAWFVERLRKKYIREIIASLNYIIILVITGFVLDIKFGNFEAEDERAKHSQLLMMVNNFQPIILMDVILVCFLTKSLIAKWIFVGLTILFIQGMLVLEAGTDFFKEQENVQYFCLYMVCEWFFAYIFAATFRALDKEKFRFMLQQSQENDMFKRVIDAVDDAMIIVSPEDLGNIIFKNKSATALFFADETEGPLEVLERQQVFLYQKEASEDGTEATTSLSDLILKKRRSRHQIYTRHREIGTCTSMAQAQMITKLKEKKAAEGDSLGFDFFLAKIIRLEESQATGTPEARVVQLVDISEKIYNDSLASEQKYLTFITATVSHEMRNPLNSLIAQLDNQASQVEELARCPSRQSPQVLSDLQQSLEIAQSAAKLLNFNVENIVSLPKLKDKTYQKSIFSHDIESLIAEITTLVAWTAEQKGIEISVQFSGFSDRKISLDKKGVQQVLLNYLSNAIKFTNKANGRVSVVASLVNSPEDEEAASVDFCREIYQLYGDTSLLKGSEGRHESSIFLSEEGPLLVLSVMDNGIGIEEANQQRLYNLFSGLQQGEAVEAKGIGLGVVVSSMISTELGGQSQIHSRPSVGSIFQSSFRVQTPCEPGVYSPYSRFSSMFRHGFPKVEEIEALPTEDTKDFLEFFLQKQNSMSTRISQPEREDDCLKRILIVDDEPYNCLALLTLLKSLKVKNVLERTDLCLGGKEALKQIIESIRPEGEEPRRRSASSPVRLVSPLRGQEGKNSDEGFIAEELLTCVREQKQLEFGTLRRAIPSSSSLRCDYGLILSDCSMPLVDGYEFTKCTRLLLQSCGISRLEDQPRIVAITGHFEPEFQLKAILSGMEKVFPKPMTQDVLKRVLEESGFEFENLSFCSME